MDNSSMDIDFMKDISGKNLIRNIVLTGPESSGKTSLGLALSRKWNKIFIPEYARTYLEKYGASYQFIDLLNIAKRQDFRLKDLSKKETLIISDTGPLVMKIWSEDKFNMVHPYIQQSFNAEKSNFYILCKPDIAWEQDPLREDRGNRQALFESYLSALKENEKSFIIVGGTIENRLNTIMAFFKTNKIVGQRQ